MSISDEGEISVSSMEEMTIKAEKTVNSDLSETVKKKRTVSRKRKYSKRLKSVQVAQHQDASKMRKEALLRFVSHPSPMADRELISYENVEGISPPDENQPLSSSSQSVKREVDEPIPDALVAANEGADIFSRKPSAQDLTLKEQRRRLKSIEYLNRKRRRDMMAAARKMESSQLPCKYYREGHCSKGDECTFSHNVPQIRKQDACKFYMSGMCNKGDSCLYMHADFPCKFFHNGVCRMGDECKFSHAQLTPQMRQLLESQAASAEKMATSDPKDEFQSTVATTSEPPMLGCALPLFSKAKLTPNEKTNTVNSSDSSLHVSNSLSNPSNYSSQLAGEPPPPLFGHVAEHSTRVPFVYPQRPPAHRNSAYNNYVRTHPPPMGGRVGNPHRMKSGLLPDPSYLPNPRNQIPRPHYLPYPHPGIPNAPPEKHHNQPGVPLLSHYPPTSSHFNAHRPPSYHPHIPNANHPSRFRNHGFLRPYSQPVMSHTSAFNCSPEQPPIEQPPQQHLCKVEPKQEPTTSLLSLPNAVESKALYFGASIDELLMMESLEEPKQEVSEASCSQNMDVSNTSSVEPSPVPTRSQEVCYKSDSLYRSAEAESPAEQDASDLLTTFTEAPSFALPQQNIHLHPEIPWKLFPLELAISKPKVSYSKMQVPPNLHYASKDPRLRANPIYSYLWQQSGNDSLSKYVKNASPSKPTYAPVEPPPVPQNLIQMPPSMLVNEKDDILNSIAVPKFGGVKFEIKQEEIMPRPDEKADSLNSSAASTFSGVKFEIKQEKMNSELDERTDSLDSNVAPEFSGTNTEIISRPNVAAAKPPATRMKLQLNENCALFQQTFPFSSESLTSSKMKKSDESSISESKPYLSDPRLKRRKTEASSFC